MAVDDGLDNALGILDEMIAVTGNPLEEADLFALANLALATMVARVKNGLDPDHKPFAPYSLSHAKTRLKRSLNVDPVDLAMTGHMLGSFVARAAAGTDGMMEAQVVSMGGFDALKALWHNEGTRHRMPGMEPSEAGLARDLPRAEKMPKREFLDLRHPSEVREVEALTGAQIETNYRKVFER